MNNNFNIAILQLDPIVNNQTLSLKIGLEACKKAKRLGADIAVFPEMWNIGYEFLFEGYLKDNVNISLFDIKNWYAKAISVNDNYIKEFIKLARELNMAICLSFMEKTNEKPQNSTIIIDRNGKIILKYSKVHTVDSKMEYYMQAGTDFSVCELDYEREKIRLGVMICYDRDFPESARILALKGAEIILIPNACYLSKIRLDQVKVRAYENVVGTVVVNFSGVHKGHSAAFSPIVRDEFKMEVNNELINLGEKEEICIVNFDIEKIRLYRQSENNNIKFRRPDSYGKICSLTFV